ncbi:hypothetical protein [Clostridium mediterraneense]|uniref:hypothetical protein n=1 Tax=Clostridium mediterraneense TaxID=1805472 RepID=UPI0008341BCB|nr:hypothetical protein [Clostridium mediterraneense]
MKSKKGFVILEVLVWLAFISFIALFILNKEIQRNKILSTKITLLTKYKSYYPQEEFLLNYKNYLKDKSLSEGNETLTDDFVKSNRYKLRIENREFNIKYDLLKEVFVIETFNYGKAIEVPVYYKYKLEENEIIFLRI